MVAAALTPGPGDDIALAGGLTAGKAVHLNANNATSRFGLYELRVNQELYKVGKADLNRITQSSGLPTRVHQQVTNLTKIHGRGTASGKVVEDLGEVTTAQAKAAETARVRAIYNQTGRVPPGNQRSFKP